MSEIQSWFPSVADGACQQVARGKAFEEVYCVYPALQHFYMKYVTFLFVDIVFFGKVKNA